MCRRRGRLPFVTREGTRADLVKEEDFLVDFALTLQAQGHAEGTVRGALFAVRFHHVSEGYPDPLVGRPRLWMVMKAIKRKSGKVTRKYPVTAKMMKSAAKMM